MNKQEEIFFESLSKNRSHIADVMEQPAVRGYKDSVVDKYSDQAHFIYELIQNADDVHARKVKFTLENSRLIFAHNGTRHFSVSDPNKEGDDTKNKKLGDINAITSIANSNKKGASTIGKFGVGFKAVFQYTETPHIYDPNFKFKIERFIVPIALRDDFPGRKEDETIFVFPFNHHEKKEIESYEDISDKLKNLSSPLLFLSHLESIEFSYNSHVGKYNKSIQKTICFNDTVAELITLNKVIDNKADEEQLWLFSRLDEAKRRYSVGFYIDPQGKLKPSCNTAFCFFPTKEVTNLKFILHAPFLLTDSREGILAGLNHNNKLIEELADLAADSMVYLKEIGIKNSNLLIEDNIVEIIPVDKELFSNPFNKDKISFYPFYESIKKKFEDSESELIPTNNGYTIPNNAYWAAVPQLPQLFTNEQLKEITANEQAEWAFVSLGRDETQRNKKVIFNYIDDIVRTYLNEDAIINGRTKQFYYNRTLGTQQSLVNIKGITSEFIERQNIEWLHSFYKWVSETPGRTDLILKKTVFLEQSGKAVAAFDKENQLILFLPVDGMEGYPVINEKLLENTETQKLIERIGIKQPSLRDQIYNKILPLYKGSDNDEIDTDPHFKIFFEYYCKCANEEVDAFINLIKDCEFLTFYYPNDDQPYRAVASSLYFPKENLEEYFRTKEDTRFLALDEYKEMINPDSEKFLLQFLKDLGVKSEITINTVRVDNQSAERKYLPVPTPAKEIEWKEPQIDGCKEILEHIEKKHDKSKSILLWNTLLRIIETRCIEKSIEITLRGEVRYFHYKWHTDYYPSLITQMLQNKQWLVDQNGDFVAPNQLSIESLDDNYDKSSNDAFQLIRYLGIDNKSHLLIQENNSNLSADQREKIAFADKIKALGIKDDEDIEDYLEYKRKKEAQKLTSLTKQDSSNNDPKGSSTSTEEEFDELFNSSENEKSVIDKPTRDVIKDITRRIIDHNVNQSSSDVLEDDECDEDDFLHSTVDYRKQIERAKQKSAAEIDRITYFEELQKQALSSEKYTFKWFSTLLEMESLNSGESNHRSKDVSISFAKVEREPNTLRTLVLKHPNQHIPQFIEDLADIPLVLHMGNQSKTIAIEVASIKSYTLRVKLKKTEAIDDIDLSSITSATIDTKNPAFLIEELRKQFAELHYDEDFNMQKYLCENIKFIFGPPGTGKTTHIAKNVILPLMAECNECKVLVLTPTNKSADVLVRRIMEVSEEDTTYNDWLLRFGATADEAIESSSVFKDKTFDIRTHSKNVTVTTISRFPYDFFMPEGARIFLCGINWDYIIIDEASMIPLANIIFPLYKKTPKQFIIAGDPFQIEPITSIDLWKNENIYSMVHLNSFTNPNTIPFKYNVELLTTQYRSIPEIGNIFSNFAYGGILKHFRGSESQKPLNIEAHWGIKALNIIKFPVSKYESIYRCKRLQHSSSYQVYSALFTFEYIHSLSQSLAKNNPGSIFRIGVIAPYRAQADMIDKLLASEHLPQEVDVQVGTIHGFQGDECDIIFAIFNTPPSISSSSEMFLNKRNIINVSISRAKDYLFIVMPDDDTENINNLHLVKKVENLVQGTNAWKEFSSSDLEEKIFGDRRYLENNAFSTSHQNVNVYGLPEKIYEVRAEDSAVDVQIHRTAKQSMSNNQKITNDPKNEPQADNSFICENKINSTEMKNETLKVQTSGSIDGICTIVPYDGKLNKYTNKKTFGMFISLNKNGIEKNICVSVDKEGRIIYIGSNMYKLYENYLRDCICIKLRSNLF